jgi:predicted RNA binding protein YcfA (HicA-like mRNA interferase family)
VKLRDLLAHLRRHGCRFLREGSDHSIWENPTNGRRTAVPRHREVPEFTASRICRQLGIPSP